MMKKLASFFKEKCPVCHEPLQAEATNISSTKSCMHGHYKEETYHQLGIRIVYDK